ncbi:MAG TPA: restriction endonuclease [Candidatus Acidoferrales bacterium]|nr:restriction endonuclease [Candidatus Acidoferrales bacterium]
MGNPDVHEQSSCDTKEKGADGGIDGLFYFWNGGNHDVSKMVLQVKSGSVQRKDIAALRGDMEKEGASMACLITLEGATKPMKQDAKSAGIYENRLRGIKCDRIRIVQVEEVLHGAARLDLPLNVDATVKARRDAEGDQLKLDLRPAKEDGRGAPAKSEPKRPTQIGYATRERGADPA